MDPRLQRLQAEISSAIAGLSPEQFTGHPPGKWCIAEVLEHLYLTYTGTAKGFSRILEAGKPQVTAATWTQRGRRLVVLGLSYLPEGREAPQFTRPRGLPGEKVRAEIGLRIAEMDDMIAGCFLKVVEEGCRPKISGTVRFIRFDRKVFIPCVSFCGHEYHRCDVQKLRREM